MPRHAWKVANSSVKSRWRSSLKFLNKFHWFEWTLIIVVMGFHLYAALSAPHNFPSRWFTRDDAYYYFKVAQNISEGHGSSFDGINLTNGYHPLWMLICIPIFSLARFDLILPLRIMLLVMAALSVATSILLFRLLKKQLGLPIAMLAAAFWGLNLEIHAIITQQGMETGIVAFTIVLLLYALQKFDKKPKVTARDYLQLAFLALLALLSRLDNIFLVLVVGAWVVFRRNPIRYLLPADLIITFSLIVAAYIQRASLKIYLAAFDNSALVMATITFIVQTIIFYFTGLYARPARLARLQIVIMTLVGTSLTAILAALLMTTVTKLTNLGLPRAVPAMYWVGMTLATLVIRLSLKNLSPWPVTLTKGEKPYLGFLAGKNHFLASLEPLPKWIKDAALFFGVSGAGLGVYMGFNQFMFSTPMPVSGQIKRWWGTLANDVYGGGAKTFLDVYGFDPEHSQPWRLFTQHIFAWSKSLADTGGKFDGWYWLLIAIIMGLALALFLRDREKNLYRIFAVGFIPLLASAQLHAFVYGAMSYAAKHEWYWVLQMLSLTVGTALFLAALQDRFGNSMAVKRTFALASLVGCLLLAFAFGNEMVQRMPIIDAQAGKPYMDTLPILEGNTQAGSLIGMTGGGNTGYYIQGRTIINMDGLINSYPYFKSLQENKAGQYLSKIGLGYIFANRYIITSSMPYRYQFSDDELIAVDGAPNYGQKELMQYVPNK